VSGPTIVTARLVMRRWQEADRASFAALNADPEVMEYFAAPLSRAESDRLVDRIEAGFEADGFGFWALEVRSSGTFIGFTGLSVVSFDVPFAPTVEIGWRLARPAWGHGYATEAARASLDHGFGDLGLDEVVAFTYRGNDRSRAVMERLGMGHEETDDFVHPALVGHRLAPHVLYRVSRERWAASGRDLSRGS
jgi:RimJ/RimL family protein N-acetyltransferase